MRYDFLDFAKGIGIILVVMGHSLFPLHQAIDIFHMPLFFFLAGLTLKKYDNLGHFIIKKANRIIIPLLFFSFCSNVIEELISYQGPIFNGPLWFLYAMFGGIIIAEVVIKSVSHDKIIWMTLIIAVLIYVINKLEYSDIIPFYLERSIRASVFMLIGYIAQPWLLKTGPPKTNSLIIAFSFIIFYAVGLYLSMKYYKICGIFKTGEICNYSFVLFYATSLCGILATIYLCKIVNNIKIINWLGCNSIVIMCTHFPFVEWLNKQLSTTAYYISYGITGKIGLGLLAYTLTFLFCIPFIYVCKRCIPQFTGYEPLITT